VPKSLVFITLVEFKSYRYTVSNGGLHHGSSDCFWALYFDLKCNFVIYKTFFRATGTFGGLVGGGLDQLRKIRKDYKWDSK
jgi:hypothetical protein